MAPNRTQPKDIDAYLLANIDDAMARMQYTYKSHEKAADKYHCWEGWRRGLSILMTTLAAGSFLTALTAFFSAGRHGGLIAGAVATISALVATMGDILRFPERCNAHSKAGVITRDFFLSYESLRADYLSGALTAGEVRDRRNQLQVEEKRMLLEVPRTTRFDYWRADRALSKDEKTSEAQDRVRAGTVAKEERS